MDQGITVVFKLNDTFQKYLCNPKDIQDDFKNFKIIEIKCNGCDNKCVPETRRIGYPFKISVLLGLHVAQITII